MNFSRFITSPSAERPLSSVEASLCSGKVCQKGKESAHPFHLPPRAFSFFFVSIIAIFIGIPSGSLYGGERQQGPRQGEGSLSGVCNSRRRPKFRQSEL